MKNIEITEHYEDGKIVKRFANGVELPISKEEKELPVFIQQKIIMTKEEFENIYGKRDKIIH